MSTSYIPVIHLGSSTARRLQLRSQEQCLVFGYIGMLAQRAAGKAFSISPSFIAKLLHVDRPKVSLFIKRISSDKSHYQLLVKRPGSLYTPTDEILKKGRYVFNEYTCVPLDELQDASTKAQQVVVIDAARQVSSYVHAEDASEAAVCKAKQNVRADNNKAAQAEEKAYELMHEVDSLKQKLSQAEQTIQSLNRRIEAYETADKRNSPAGDAYRGAGARAERLVGLAELVPDLLPQTQTQDAKGPRQLEVMGARESIQPSEDTLLKSKHAASVAVTGPMGIDDPEPPEAPYRAAKPPYTGPASTKGFKPHARREPVLFCTSNWEN